MSDKPCQCGQVYQQQCDSGLVPYPVKVLWMPPSLRQQHRTLGRTSIQRRDGAVILSCNPECAWRILEDEGVWAEEA